jgi:hypothetical protein
MLLSTIKLAEAFLSLSLFTLPIIPSLSETTEINHCLKMKDHNIHACVICSDHITDQVNHIPGLDKTARGRGGTAEPALTSGLASLPRCLLFTTVLARKVCYFCQVILFMKLWNINNQNASISRQFHFESNLWMKKVTVLLVA